MRLLVGYNITDRAYNYMKEKDFKGLEHDSFEFDSIKVFDLDSFSFYDMDLRECAENDIEILGCNIVYAKYLYSCDYVKVTLKGEIVYYSNSMNFFSSSFKKECSPLFYKGKLTPVTGSCDGYLTYKNNNYTIIIELETLNFEVRVYDFIVYKSGTLSEYYGDFGFSMDIHRELKETLRSLVSEEDKIVYVGDILAVCGRYIRTDNSSSSAESMLKNGIKYVYIAITTYAQTFVIPPTVEKISIDSKFKNYLSMHNHIKLILPKVKLDSLVCQLAKEMKLSEDGYLGTLEKEIDALNKKHVLIEVYG
jgi:hypothetical protein